MTRAKGPRARRAPRGRWHHERRGFAPCDDGSAARARTPRSHQTGTCGDARNRRREDTSRRARGRVRSARMGWWRHAIALWVVVHVASTCVSAVPDPRFAMKKDTWKDPRVQAEFNTWARRFGMERAAFEDLMWRLGSTGVQAHALIDAPFAPYFWLSANRQRWPMFGAGSAESDRYEVRVRSCRGEESACPWTRVYRTADATARTLATELESPRVRSLVSTASYRGHGSVRRRTCSAVAHALFSADAPSGIVEVECSFLRERARAPRAAAPQPPAPERERVMRYTRESLAASQADHRSDG